MDENRDKLLWAVLRETVRHECPHELPFLHGIWHAWRSRDIPGGQPDHQSIDGIPALGENDEECTIVNFLLIMSSFIGSLPALDAAPSKHALEDGLRAAGAIWGLRGKDLEDAVAMGTSRFIQVMHQMMGSLASTSMTESARYWMLKYDGGIPNQPLLIGSEQPNPQGYPKNVDLIVDEPRGALIGSRATIMLTQVTSRERIGLWLALAKSGASFGHEDILERVAPGTVASEDMPRKYKMFGQRLCEKLTGLAVISEGRNKRYSIAPDAWTWAWILESPEVECSLLLHPDR